MIKTFPGCIFLFASFLLPLFGYPELFIDEDKHYSQVYCLEHKLRGTVFKRTVKYPKKTIIELYDNLGKCREIRYLDSVGVEVFKDNFTYKNNQVISSRENGPGTIEVAFNDKMQLTLFSDSNGIDITKVVKSYDKKGNLANEQIRYSQRDSIFRILGYRGNLIRIVTKNEKGKEITRKIIKYNSLELPELIEVSGEQKQRLYTITTEFDKNNVPLKGSRIGKSEHGGKQILQTVMITRDTYSNPIKVEIANFGPETEKTYVIDISYEYW
jgi:hypothetical protein